MKTIKFRFWNIDKWAYITIGEPLSEVQRAVYSRACINGGKFYQFTGLHDKNGKEIYEGDIINGQEVKWFDEHACFFLGNHPLCYSVSHREIQGNAHQNPEML